MAFPTVAPGTMTDLSGLKPGLGVPGSPPSPAVIAPGTMRPGDPAWGLAPGLGSTPTEATGYANLGGAQQEPSKVQADSMRLAQASTISPGFGGTTGMNPDGREGSASGGASYMPSNPSFYGR